jgi:Rrf2 family iron-sulfur cluster assembly transcriptional regulator
MKISTKAQYGLRAMAYLAKNPGKICPIAKIAAAENISADYLEKIVSKLEKSGFLTAKKGKTGGYTLAVSPAKIRLGDLIGVLEGRKTLVKCLDGKCPQCRNCVSKNVWETVQARLDAMLNKITLQNIIEGKV